MSDPDDAEWIEIEVHSSGPGRTAPHGPAGGADFSSTGRRNSLGGVAVAAVIAIVAALGGFAVGYLVADGDDSDDVERAAETSIAVPVEARTTLPPVTLRRSPTTTTEALRRPRVPPPPTERSVDVAAGLPGGTLVGLTEDDRLIELDLSSGATTTWDATDMQFGSPTLFAGADWIVVPSFGVAGAAVIFGADADIGPVALDLGLAEPVLGLRRVDTYWRIDEYPNSPIDLGRATELRFDGAPTGTVVEFTGVPVLSDPAGGLITATRDGTYVVNRDGVRWVSPGVVVAIDAQTVVSRECLAICEYVVVDRTTGDRRVLPLQPGVEDHDPVLSMSPDGQFALLQVIGGLSGESTMAIVDLQRAVFGPIVAAPSAGQFAWTSDGSGVIWLDTDGRPTFTDASTGTNTRIAEQLTGWTAFAVTAPPTRLTN